MADSPVKTTPTTINPAFFVPEGVVDFEYTPSLLRSDIDGLDETVLDTGGSDIIIGVDETDSQFDVPEITLAVPANVVVISQTIRTAPGGQQVIDLIIEVDDVEGATDYEVQTTKI